MTKKRMNERQEYRGKNGEKIFRPAGIEDKGSPMIACVETNTNNKGLEIVAPGDESIEALKNMGTVSENMTIPASTNEVRIEKNGNKETIERIGANGEVVSVTVVDLKSIAKTLNKADIER